VLTITDSGDIPMNYVATCKGEDVQIKVGETDLGSYSVRVDGDFFLVDFFSAQENIYSLIIDHHSYEVDIDEGGRDQYSVLLKDDHFDVQIVDEKKKKLAEKLGAKAGGLQEIKSPMAGNIWKLMKNQGDTVKEGEVLLILEAMKMENEIRSPIEGVVTSMNAVEGAAVSAGALLCLLEPAEK
jgi:biotin carboxyl carrier protein